MRKNVVATWHRFQKRMNLMKPVAVSIVFKDI